MKKMLSAIAAVILAVSLSAGSVMAAGSDTATSITIVNNNESGDRYVVKNITEVPSFKQIEESAPKVAEAIKAVNQVLNDASSTSEDVKKVTDTLVNELEAVANSDDPNLPASVKESAKAVAEAIKKEGLETLTGFFDVDRTGEGVEKTANGEYIVRLKIPTITSAVKTVKVLHYSTQRNVWELLDATINPDLTITVIFPDLSPVMILCNAGAVNNVVNMSGTSGSTTGSRSTSATTSTTTSATSTAKSPKTEDTTGSWMGFAIAAIVLAGAGVLVIRRKRA